MHSKSSPSNPVRGTRTTHQVRHPSQLDLFRAFWRASSNAPEASVAPVGPRTGTPGPTRPSDQIPAPDGSIRVEYYRHPRAKRYRLLFRQDGTARCTIPRGGSLNDARRFVAQQEPWLVDRWKSFRARKLESGDVAQQRSVMVRGENIPVPDTGHLDAGASVRIGDIEFQWVSSQGDAKSQFEAELRRRAVAELPERLMVLARRHGLEDRVSRITVRAQRTRWGSCTRRGAISLNWRLMQLPPAVCDYIIVHELAHLRHLNHSRQFWAEVERLCPDYVESETWLRHHGRLVL